jgi:hypothetical protein
MRFNRILKAVAATSAMIVLLSGCATAPTPEQRTEALANYSNSHSRALNITGRLMFVRSGVTPMPKYVKDTYIPDDKYDELVKLSQKTNGANPASGQGLAFGTMVASDIWLKSANTSFSGSGLGLTAALFFLTPREAKYQEARFFGFHTKSAATEPKQARDNFREMLVNKLKASLTQAGFVDIKTGFKDEKPWLGNKEDYPYHYYIQATNPQTGHKVSVHMWNNQKHSAEVRQMPAWLKGTQDTAWLILSPFRIGGGYYVDGKFQPVEWYKFLESTAKHLPDNVFLLQPPHPYTVEDGKEKWAGPFVADNKSMHLFVMPESAKNAK